MSEFSVFILKGQEKPVGWYHRWWCSPTAKSVFYALFCCCFHHLARWLSSALHRAALLNPLRLAWKHTGHFYWSSTSISDSYWTNSTCTVRYLCVCCLCLWINVVVSVCYTVDYLGGCEKAKRQVQFRFKSSSRWRNKVDINKCSISSIKPGVVCGYPPAAVSSVLLHFTLHTVGPLWLQ